MRKVAGWMMRDALVAYLAKFRAAARDQHNTNMVIWAAKTSMGGGAKPPELPLILR